MEIVFFGSGPVAAASLELLAKDFVIEAVITKPQPAHHKEPFPVLEVVSKLGLRVFTPNSKKELSELFKTKPVKSQVGVVIDYGFIINKDVIDYFQLGIINSHFSLLPKWRGADPISFAILNGDTETGVSLMLIVEKMDEGPLLAQASYKLSQTETTPRLTDGLIKLSHQLLQETLYSYLSGACKAVPQSSDGVSYSHKLAKSDGIIDWSKPAVQLEREVRAYIEWPKSRAVIAGKDVIITSSEVITAEGKPGTFEVVEKALLAYCGEGSLNIEKLKPAGKPEMTAQAFLAGHGKTLNN